jgi:hypothetical protein
MTDAFDHAGRQSFADDAANVVGLEDFRCRNIVCNHTGEIRDRHELGRTGGG